MDREPLFYSQQPLICLPEYGTARRSVRPCVRMLPSMHTDRIYIEHVDLYKHKWICSRECIGAFMGAYSMCLASLCVCASEIEG